MKLKEFESNATESNARESHNGSSNEPSLAQSVTRQLNSDVEGSPKGAFNDGIDNVGAVMGSLTGEGEEVVAPGGWAGNDDATSTAPSDLMGLLVEDKLAELTGGAVSDEDPMIEGDFSEELDEQDLKNI